MSETKMTFEEFQILLAQFNKNKGEESVEQTEKTKTKQAKPQQSKKDVLLQKNLFGNTSKAFSLLKLRNIMTKDAAQEDHDFLETKKYFLTYFAKSLGTTFYQYEPQENGEEGLIINLNLCPILQQCHSEKCPPFYCFHSLLFLVH